MVVNMEKVISLFLSKPISIQMQYIYDLEEYPSITICPSTIVSSMESVKLRYMNKDGTQSIREYPIDPYPQKTNAVTKLINEIIEPLWTHLYEWEKHNFNIGKKSQIYLNSHIQFLREASIKHTLMKYLLANKISHMTRHHPFNLVYSCEFSLQSCNFNNFRLVYHPVYKTCFTFQHSAENRRLGYPEYLSFLAYNSNLDGGTLYNTRSLSLFRGGFYEIHPYKTMAMMKYTYPYAQESRQIVSITKSIVNLVNSTNNPCYEKVEDIITLVEDDVGFEGIARVHNYRYSTELCEQLRIQDVVFELCNCVSSILPLSKDQNDSFMSPRKCAELPMEIFDKNRISSKSGLFRYSENASTMNPLEFVMSFKEGSRFIFELGCHLKAISNESVKIDAIKKCLSPCNKVTYDIRVNEKEFNMKDKLGQYKHLFNEFYEHLELSNSTKFCVLNRISNSRVVNYTSGFHLYFQTSDTKLTSQSIGYTLVNMFTDFGGVLGLWFGISIATIFELIELLVLLTGFEG